LLNKVRFCAKSKVQNIFGDYHDRGKSRESR
jgi:hypothetical protein